MNQELRGNKTIVAVDFKLFYRFLLIGIINTIFGYSIFAFGIFLGLQSWLALLLSTILGIIFNFKTFGSFVFNSRDASRFINFIASYGALYLINLFLLKLLGYISLDPYLAGFLALFPMSILSFLFNKKFVFKK